MFVCLDYGKPTSVVLMSKTLCYWPVISKSHESVELRKISKLTSSKVPTGTKLCITTTNDSGSTEEYEFYSSSYYSDYIRDEIVTQALLVENPYLKQNEKAK